MSIMIGVISYLPKTDVRTKRLKASRTQIEWLHKILPNTLINVVAQGYNESDYLNDDLINYVTYENGIGAGVARNKLLELFYATDNDWLLLLDDDTTSYEYYSYEKFIHDVVNNPKKFIGVDAISAVEPEYHPYKKLNYEDKANLTHYKFEPRELNSGSATSIIRNIKKDNNIEIYYPDVDANKGEGREDMEFLFQWLLAGFTWYTMNTWIRKSLCFDYSSIFGSDTKERDKILIHDLDVICKKYADYGLYRQSNGQITWKNFNSLYNKSKKVLYIERETPIIFEENVIPKLKKPNCKSLF